MILAIIGSYSGGIRSPAVTAVSTRTPGPAGISHVAIRPGVGAEAARWILREQADLDRVRPWLRRDCRGREHLVGERPSSSDEELFAHEIETRNELRHPVLHLEPGVDLEEPEPAVGIEQELCRCRVRKPGDGRGADGQGVDRLALLRGQSGCGRFLDQLLVATLDRAVALADGDDGASVIAQQLDLDVTRGADLTFEVDGTVAEGRRCLA